jgi:hypothetical protein
MEYKTEDATGSGTVNNVEGILRTNLPTKLPYAGFRDFNISAVSANDSSSLFKYPATENWQKAIGAYNFWVTGTVTAKDVAGKLSYSVQYTIHAIDRYNFNKGMKDIKTGTSDNVNWQVFNIRMGSFIFASRHVFRIT